MQKKLIFSLIIFVLIVNIASAATYDIEFNQYEEKVLEKHYIILDEKQEVSIQLPKDYESLEVENEHIIANGQIIVNDKEIIFSFVNTQSIDRGDHYYLTRKIAPGISLEKLSIDLILDEGFIVGDNIFPEPSVIGSDGRRIIIGWDFENLNEDGSVPIFIVFEKVRGASYLLIVLVLLIIVIAVYFSLPILKKKLAGKKEVIKRIIKKKKKEDVTKYLLDNEKKVYEEAKKEKRRGIWQKQIQIRTGLSKVKLSRILRNLEKRGLIRKQNFGKTNKIFAK
jgi:hypothetical protein